VWISCKCRFTNCYYQLLCHLEWQSSSATFSWSLGSQPYVVVNFTQVHQSTLARLDWKALYCTWQTKVCRKSLSRKVISFLLNFCHVDSFTVQVSSYQVHPQFSCLSRLTFCRYTI
jgi:hypothetical protein